MEIFKQGIYALFDGDELVYIGQAKSLYARVGRHIREGAKSFDSFELFPVEGVEEWLGSIESRIISYFQPKYNIAHSGETPKHVLLSKQRYIKRIQQLIDIEVKEAKRDTFVWEHGIIRCSECALNPDNGFGGYSLNKRTTLKYQPGCNLINWNIYDPESDGCTRGVKTVNLYGIEEEEK